MGYKGFRWRVLVILVVAGAVVEARESITVGVGVGMLNAINYTGGELFRADYVYVSLHSLPDINETEGLRYAVPRSFVGSEFIREEGARVSEVGDWTQLALLLKFDRIDVAVLPELMVENVFKDGGIEIFQQPAGKLPISFYISGNSQKSGVADRLLASVEQCSVDDPRNPPTAE
jgi:hypothetical protein